MNAPLHPEVLRLREESQQEALLLLPEGVQRYVWEGRFGAMLIEVIDGVAYVDGERVGRRQSEWPVKRHSSWPVGWG